MTAHSKTPYITPSMDFPLGMGSMGAQVAAAEISLGRSRFDGANIGAGHPMHDRPVFFFLSFFVVGSWFFVAGSWFLVLGQGVV